MIHLFSIDFTHYLISDSSPFLEKSCQYCSFTAGRCESAMPTLLLSLPALVINGAGSRALHPLHSMADSQ